MSEEMNVSQALKEKGVTGDYVPMRTILDQKVLITNVMPVTTQYGDGLRISILHDGKEEQTLTQSPAVVDKLNAVADMLPLYGTFVERVSPKSHRKYYDVK